MPTTTTYRVCDLCGGVDDGPRHVFVGAEENFATDPDVEATLGENLTALMKDDKVSMLDAASLMSAYRDTTTSDRHIGCCADAGCPTGTCQKE